MTAFSGLSSNSFFFSGWFWGDPHIKTLDGGNYTFNGLGEYVMIDARDGTFQLQARTGLAQGNSTIATIFTAGTAKEKNTDIVEVRVKKGGKIPFKKVNGAFLSHHFTNLVENCQMTMILSYVI